MNETSPVLSCRGLGKRFVEGGNVVAVLNGVGNRRGDVSGALI